ncbi:GlsB/YeaQ/YmgE family stress response membrane protein [Terrabacter sp. GCM10028922]|uniref:GlsB/YeaQ/YmgE family stress response membrane protein n=1 Tax=Terrabacter sp. GCM10028922 TaxID=3273428 RepID=UPI0036241091
MIGTILMALVAGAIVGPLARLVLPGRQDMSVLLTVILGAIGSLIGAFIYYKATGVDDTKGIDWISGLIGVVVAAALIVGYGMVTGNRQTR